MFALDTMVELVLSANVPWITAMKACAKHSQAPFDPGENFEPVKKWTGTVKYNMSIGKVLQFFDTGNETGQILPHNLILIFFSHDVKLRRFESNSLLFVYLKVLVNFSIICLFLFFQNCLRNRGLTDRKIGRRS